MEKPDETKKTQPPDLEIDPRHGYCIEETYENLLYFTDNITADNFNKIRYIPTSTPKVWFPDGTFNSLLEGLFWTPKSVSYTIEDAEIKMDMKTTAESQYPITIQNLGMKFYNNGHDLTEATSFYPFSDVGDLEKIEKIVHTSTHKRPQNVLFANYARNLWKGVDGQYYQAAVLPQDPKWKGITCAADQPIYGMTWNNDVGMNRCMSELFTPNKIYFTQSMCKGVIAEADVNEYKQFLDSPEDIAKKRISAISLTPFDYRQGWRHYARCGFSDMQEHDYVTTTDTKPHLRILAYEPSFTSTTSSVGKNKFTRRKKPYQPRYGSTYESYTPSFHGQKMFLKFIRTNTERDAVFSQSDNPPWTTNTAFNFRPMSSPFAGHKNIRDIRWIVDPLRHGKDLTPINCNFKLRVKMTINVFMKNPDYRNPFPAEEGKIIKKNRVTFAQASDFTNRLVKMHNPFQIVDASFTL